MGISPKQKTDVKTGLIKELLTPKQRPEKPQARQRLEFELQCACHAYIELQYPNFYSFHIANERKVKKVGRKQIPLEGAALKKAGVKRGNPDYWILESFELNGADYKGTIVELKAKGKLNNTSPEQKQCIRDLRARGYFVEVTDNIETFVDIIDRNYLKHKKNKWQI